MLNKPAGVVSATEDRKERTVLDLLGGEKAGGLFPVGRLDKDTEGLLLITNDGALAHRLLHPGKHVDKTYYAKLAGEVTPDMVRAFAQGLSIGDEKPTLPARLVVLESGAVSTVEITICEGRFHQIKRMAKAVGTEVLYLKRLAMGPLRLDRTLPAGSTGRCPRRKKSSFFAENMPAGAVFRWTRKEKCIIIFLTPGRRSAVLGQGRRNIQMGIFKRIWNWLCSLFGGGKKKEAAELERCVRTMQEALGNMKAQTEAVVAAQEKRRREIARCEEEIAKMGRYAEKAVREDRDSEARFFLEKKAGLEKRLAGLTKQRDMAAGYTYRTGPGRAPVPKGREPAARDHGPQGRRKGQDGGRGTGRSHEPSKQRPGRLLSAFDGGRCAGGPR